MNLQILIPLDDLTPENGATSVRPYTQVVAEYPTNVEEYRSELVGQNFVTSAVRAEPRRIGGLILP